VSLNYSGEFVSYYLRDVHLVVILILQVVMS